MAAFAEQMAAKYSPASAYAMDICRSNELSILELGCFNSAGFYGANVTEIIRAVSEGN